MQHTTCKHCGNQAALVTESDFAWGFQCQNEYCQKYSVVERPRGASVVYKIGRIPVLAILMPLMMLVKKTWGLVKLTSRTGLGILHRLRQAWNVLVGVGVGALVVGGLATVFLNALDEKHAERDAPTVCVLTVINDTPLECTAKNTIPDVTAFDGVVRLQRTIRQDDIYQGVFVRSPATKFWMLLDQEGVTHDLPQNIRDGIDKYFADEKIRRQLREKLVELGLVNDH